MHNVWTFSLQRNTKILKTGVNGRLKLTKTWRYLANEALQGKIGLTTKRVQCQVYSKRQRKKQKRTAMSEQQPEDRTLIITLSKAEHLLDECTEEEKVVFAGPRFNTDREHLRTGKNPTTSSIIKYFSDHNIRVTGILVYADIYSLSQFMPICDTIGRSIICIVGDTHHGKNPITMLCRWLIHSNIKTIALKQTVAQAEIFEKVGFNVIKLPYYAHDVKLLKPKTAYFERVIFAGSTGPNHAKRTFYLNKLKARGIPIDVCRLPRENTFKAYNTYACAFNMPLNRDINYRIWEIMAAGSVCITERIEDNVQKNLLCKSGVSIITYSDIDDCCAKISGILRNPSTRMKIAMEGYKQIYNAKKESVNLKILIRSLKEQMKGNSNDNGSKYTKDELEYKLGCAQLYEENQRTVLEHDGKYYLKNIQF